MGKLGEATVEFEQYIDSIEALVSEKYPSGEKPLSGPGPADLKLLMVTQLKIVRSPSTWITITITITNHTDPKSWSHNLDLKESWKCPCAVTIIAAMSALITIIAGNPWNNN